MYHVLHHININNLDTKAGFIHVPFMDEQLKVKSENSLKLATIFEGVIDSIKATI
jgi:pyroglutamyl-peptidase